MVLQLSPFPLLTCCCFFQVLACMCTCMQESEKTALVGGVLSASGFCWGCTFPGNLRAGARVTCFLLYLSPEDPIRPGEWRKAERGVPGLPEGSPSLGCPPWSLQTSPGSRGFLSGLNPGTDWTGRCEGAQPTLASPSGSGCFTVTDRAWRLEPLSGAHCLVGGC